MFIHFEFPCKSDLVTKRSSKVVSCEIEIINFIDYIIKINIAQYCFHRGLLSRNFKLQKLILRAFSNFSQNLAPPKSPTVQYNFYECWKPRNGQPVSYNHDTSLHSLIPIPIPMLYTERYIGGTEKLGMRQILHSWLHPVLEWYLSILKLHICICSLLYRLLTQLVTPRLSPL